MNIIKNAVLNIEWIDKAPPGEREVREGAAKKITECFETHSSALDLYHSGITSLDGIRFPSWLIELDLSSNQIKSFKGMPDLPELINLDLDNNQIDSFEGMPFLPKLEWVSVDRNQIRSFKDMPSLPLLKSFYARSNQIDSFEGMPEMPNLKEFNVQINNIRFCRGFNLNQQITDFRLGGNPIISMHGVCILNGFISDYPEATMRQLGAEIIPRRGNVLAVTIDSELRKLFPDFDSKKEKYRTLVEHRNSQVLALFINRMAKSWPQYNKRVKDYVYLALINDRFHEVLFEEVRTTSENCQDRPLYFFSRLSIIAEYYEAQLEDNQSKMLRALLAMHSIKMIEHEANLIFRNEALEIALHLQLKLKEDLSIPTQINTMLNQEYAEQLIGEKGPEKIEEILKKCKAAQKTEEQKIAIVCESEYFQKDHITSAEDMKEIKEVSEKYSNAISIVMGDLEDSDQTYQMSKAVVEKVAGEPINISTLTEENIQKIIDTLDAEYRKEKQKLIKAILNEKARLLACPEMRDVINASFAATSHVTAASQSY